jgi:methionyl aminopeptidase
MWTSVPEIGIKTADQIELMRKAGQLVAAVLDEISTLARPGETTAQMDVVARRMISAAGAEALFLGVENPQARYPFPAAICSSLNEEVVHGIPNDRPLKSGDVLSVDCGVRLEGFCGDSARTFAVGSIHPDARRLLKVTKETLDLAIREIKPGRMWSEVARLMEQHVVQAGFGVVREFVGHGIGQEMHEEPKVPNYDDGNRRLDFELQPGMTLAVEPMVSAGSPDVVFGDPSDRWAVVTKDRSLAAHFEHVIAVTDSGADVLTLPAE